MSASLDRFFRPQAPAPIYLLGTLWLFGPFKGIMADLRQGDIPGVQTNYRACKASYRKVVGVVPDWTDRFLMQPVEALGQALASGDPPMGGVGQVRGSPCYLLDMIKAQQKHHWPDFETVEQTDLLSGEPMHLTD